MWGGVFFEHGHRLMAGFIGFLTFILVFVFQKNEGRQWVKNLAFIALGTVLSQALLGGLTVLLKLPPLVSIAHACLAQTFFCVVVTLLVVTSPNWEADQTNSFDPSVATLAWTLTAILYLQLLLGAIVRHAGLGLHYHIITGGLCFLLLIALVARTEKMDSEIFNHTLLLLGFVVVQLGFGVMIGFMHRYVWATASHVALGALILGSSLMLSLKVGRSGPRWRSFVELTKPRITMMVLMTAFGGVFLARPDLFHSRSLVHTLIHTLFGLALVVGGANGLNQYLEREFDAQMRRTSRRPLPQHRLRPSEALIFCLAITIIGLLELSFSVNLLTGLFSWFAVVTYAWVYTPLKRKTFLSTIVGAVPGAMPPVIGWVAAGGNLGIEAALLFSILFLWQLPHFLAIAWIYREDYGRAGFPMLPVLDPQGHRTSRHIIFWCLALLPVSLLPTFLGITGLVYFFGALVLGLSLLGFGCHLAMARSSVCARRLFLASDFYLPALFALMIFGVALS